MRILIAILSVLMTAINILAETPDILFESHVKSVEEFIARFNGDESSPLTDTTRSPIYSLFDFNYVNEQNTDSITDLANDFINSVKTSGARISLIDPCTHIEAECVFDFDDRQCNITLVFVMQEFGSNYRRLALSDAYGIVSSGVLEIKPMYPISPIEHELHFMSLDDLFTNKKEYLASTMPTDREVDQLSYLIACIHCGKAIYNSCQNVTVKFSNIPGFEFSIKEKINPKSFNSGWLISDLKRSTSTI